MWSKFSFSTTALRHTSVWTSEIQSQNFTELIFLINTTIHICTFWLLSSRTYVGCNPRKEIHQRFKTVNEVKSCTRQLSGTMKSVIIRWHNACYLNTNYVETLAYVIKEMVNSYVLQTKIKYICFEKEMDCFIFWTHM